jgi:hypothetical protein
LEGQQENQVGEKEKEKITKGQMRQINNNYATHIACIRRGCRDTSFNALEASFCPLRCMRRPIPTSTTHEYLLLFLRKIIYLLNYPTVSNDTQ